MSMPTDLVMIRHGQSEANVIQKERKINPYAVAPPGFFDRHDSRMRLSSLGVQQAEVTGDWVRAEFPDGFDRSYVSSLVRTVETAGRLALKGQWDVDDRWRERDWGEYGMLNESELEAQFALSRKIKGQSRWYWCPPGGESLATGVRLRFEDILGTLHRQLGEKAVLAVTHGETMEVARVVIERLLPQEWEQQEQGDAHKIANCQVLHYSRRDPFSSEVGPYMIWRRSVCVWAPSRSWDEGKWVRLPRRRYSDEQLIAMAEDYPNLLPAEVDSR